MDVIDEAVAALRKAGYTKKADALAVFAYKQLPAGLPEKFTVKDARDAYEALCGHVDRDTFRHKLLALAKGTGEKTAGRRGKPAELFTRKTS